MLDSANTTTKKCPFCAEEILVDAKKCKHCKEFIDAPLNDSSDKFNSAGNKKGYSTNGRVVGPVGRAILTIIVVGGVMTFLYYLGGQVKTPEPSKYNMDLGQSKEDSKRLDEIQGNIDQLHEEQLKNAYEFCRKPVFGKSREQCIDELSRDYKTDFRKFSWAF